MSVDAVALRKNLCEIKEVVLLYRRFERRALLDKVRHKCSQAFFFFSSRRRHTRFKCDWSSDVCSSDLPPLGFRTTMRCMRTLFCHIRVVTRFALKPTHAPERTEERRVGKESRS